MPFLIINVSAALRNRVINEEWIKRQPFALILNRYILSATPAYLLYSVRSNRMSDSGGAATFLAVLVAEA